MCASFVGCAEATRILLKAGADPAATDNVGRFVFVFVFVFSGHSIVVVQVDSAHASGMCPFF